MKSKNVVRDIAIARRVISGVSYTTAGNAYGITAERAQQITKHVCESAVRECGSSEGFPELLRPLQKMPAIARVRANAALWNNALELLEQKLAPRFQPMAEAS